MRTRLVSLLRHLRHVTKLREASTANWTGWSGWVKEQFFQLLERFLTSIRPGPGCIERQQAIQWVNNSWHIGNEFTIIIHQPQERFQFRYILRLRNFLDGLYFARRRMDSISIHHKRKILNWRLHKHTFWVLQFHTHTVQTFQSTLQVAKMLLVIRTSNN